MAMNRRNSHKYFNNILSELIQTKTNLMNQTVGDIDTFQYLWEDVLRMIDFKYNNEPLFSPTQDRLYRNINGIICKDGALIECYKVQSDPEFEKNLIYSFTENERKIINYNQLIEWLEFRIHFNDIIVTKVADFFE